MSSRAQKILDLALLKQHKESPSSNTQRKVVVQKLVDYEESLSSISLSSEKEACSTIRSYWADVVSPDDYKSSSAENKMNIFNSSEEPISFFENNDLIDHQNDFIQQEQIMETEQSLHVKENLRAEDSVSEQNTEIGQSEDIFSEEFQDPYETDDSVADRDYSPSSEQSNDYGTSSDSSFSNVHSNNATDVERTDLESDEIENDGTTNGNDKWGPIVSRPQDFIFNSSQKINCDKTTIKDPIDAYRLFVTDDVLELIVTETNKYAGASELSCRRVKKRKIVWKNTNKEEILIFFLLS